MEPSGHLANPTLKNSLRGESSIGHTDLPYSRPTPVVASMAPTRRDAGVSSPDDDDDPRTGPLTDQEREFLEAFRELGEADRVLVWSAILTELGRHADPAEEEARHR